MVLSDRLEMILSLVPAGCIPVDIGTDHGFVPVELVRRGLCPSAFAMDVRKGPLARATEHIRMAGLTEKIEVRLSDGFAALQKGEANAAIIAGMGGGLMARILLNGSEVTERFTYLILSPHSEAFRVRQILPELGFSIEEEKMVREDGKFYPGILAVRKKDMIREPDRFLEDRFGPVLLRKKDPILKEYLVWQDGIIEGILSGLSGEGENVSLRRDELETERACIRKAFTRYYA